MLEAALFDWPFFALLVGLLGAAILLGWPRRAGALSRWRDPAWLVCWMLPVYMLHQFEEHGVDFLGERYHFIDDLCLSLGHADLAQCPANPAFILAVNVGVWVSGVFAILERRRNLMVGACALGLPFVNALAHLGQALYRGSYNSGLLSAVVLFLPLVIWTLLQLWRAHVLDAKRLGVVVASGLLMHVVLIASLAAHGAGRLPELPLLLINFFNGFLPVALGTLFRPATPGG